MKKKSVYSILIVLTLTMLLIFGGLLTASVLANDDDKIVGEYPNDGDLPSEVLDLERYKFDPPVSGTAEGITIDIYDTDDGQVFDWVSDRPIAYVFVKGGPSGYLYDYTPFAYSGEGLHAPLGSSGRYAGLSHITFYFARIVPELEIVKSGDDLSKVGDLVDYTFTISNLGNIDLELVSVIDDVIGDLSSEFPAVLYVGDEVTVEISHEVPEGSVDWLTNTVEAIYSVAGDASWTVSSSDSHSVELFTAGVSIEKEADRNLVKAGDVINYTITVTNLSSANAPLLEGTVIDDMLGLNDSFSLAYGGTAVFEESYTVQESDSAPLVNTAYVNASPAGFPNEYSDEASFEVDIFEPSITIEKTGDDLSKAGDDVTYTITVENTSTSNSPNLVGSLVDPMLGLDIPLDMAPGDVETFTEVYTIPEDAVDFVENTATVTVTLEEYGFDGLITAAVISDEITASASHTVELFTAGVSIEKVADRELVKAGDVVNYTITVRNESSSNAPLLEATLTDTMLGLSESFGLGFGEEAVFEESYTVLESDVAPLTNTAVVDASPLGFPNEYREEASWTLDIFEPSITIDKTGDELSKAGDDVEYTITVENTSSSNSPNLIGTVEDTLLGFVADINLAPGGIFTTTIPYTIPLDAVDFVDNTATVRVKPEGYSAITDEVSADASHSVELFTAAVSITKEADKSLARVGETVNYVIRVTNESSENAPDLAGTMTDEMLDLSETFTLSYGESIEYYPTYIIQPEDIGRTLTNTASVVASPVGFPNRFDPYASWSVEVFEPSIEIEKTGDELSKAGDDVTYTITVRNTSTENSPNLIGSLTDPMLGLDIALNMAPGDVYTTSVDYTIPGDAVDEVLNTATVTVNPEGFSDVSDQITASASHLVDLFTAGVSVSKTADKSLVKAGEVVNYTITVTNDSSDNAPILEATLTDTMLGLSESFSLAFGESAVFNESYTVLESDVAPLINTAVVDASPAGFPNQYSAEDSWTLDIFEPSIVINKTGDELSKAGDDVTYTITVENTSSDNSPNLIGTLSDPMLGLSIALNMAPGDVASTSVDYTIPMDAVDEVLNTATVTVTPDGYTALSDEITASSTHRVELFTAGVSITKTGDKTQAFVGEAVNYTIVVSNLSSANAPDLVGTMTDAMLGLNESFSLGYGESIEYYPSYTIQPEDPDPFVNIAEVTASPDGFPNVYTDEASWSVDLIYGETAWAAHDVGVYRYNERGNWATYVVYAELDDGMANIYAGQDIYVGYVEFVDIGGGEVRIDIYLDGWEFLPGITNLHVQDYDREPRGNPAPGSFDYDGLESGLEASIVVPLNDYYGVHLVVYEVD